MSDNIPNVGVSDIGVDPSMVNTIESLDVLPAEKNGKKNKKKKNDKNSGSVIKKILFTLLVLALMAAIGFGLYYYLSLGKNNSKTVQKINLPIKQIPVYYDLDDLVDMSSYEDKCVLDISNIDNSTVGSYTYTIDCKDTLYNGKVDVIESQKLNITTKMINTLTTDTIDINKYVVSNDNEYTFSIDDESVLKTEGIGILKVNVLKDNETLSAIYIPYVASNEKQKIFLKCSKDDLTNIFLINSTNTDMKLATISEKVKYEEDKFYSIVSTILDGTVKHNGVLKYAVYDATTFEITYISKFEYEKEFPTTFSDIKHKYEAEDYTCSLSTK